MVFQNCLTVTLAYGGFELVGLGLQLSVQPAKKTLKCHLYVFYFDYKRKLTELTNGVSKVKIFAVSVDTGGPPEMGDHYSATWQLWTSLRINQQS